MSSISIKKPLDFDATKLPHKHVMRISNRPSEGIVLSHLPCCNFCGNQPLNMLTSK